MRLLALETSSIRGSVAALDGRRLLGELSIAEESRSAAALTPKIAELLTRVGWSPADLQLIAVTQGPGSFTGLRIGVTTAKTLAYATHAALRGVNTLEVIAAQAAVGEGTLWTVLDAHREQLFTAPFRTDATGGVVATSHTTIVAVDQFLDQLSEGDVVAGPMLRKLADRLPPGTRASEPDSWDPRAATVGAIAAASSEEPDPQAVWTLAPQYFRPSAAEEGPRKTPNT